MKRTIVVNTNEHEVIEQMRDSLAFSAGIYRRAGRLVSVCGESGACPEGGDSPADAPLIRILGRETLRRELMELADYARSKEPLANGSLRFAPANPPDFGVRALMEMAPWPVPHLGGVVEAPVMLHNGKILDTFGYDAYSGLYLRPQRDAKFLPVPNFPTASQIHDATNWLNESVRDFPFAVAAGRSAWKAGLLSYFARHAHYGPAPAFIVSGNTGGVVLRKLCTTAAQICVGRRPMVVPQEMNSKAESRAFAAAALSGETVVLIDNITKPLGSAALDSVLTEGMVKQTVKGEAWFLDVKAIWWGIGNKIQFNKRSDTVRRALMIALGSPQGNPEPRSDFNPWAHRPELVCAALTILRGYIAAGRPKSGLRPWGSFEGWSGLVREALVWAGDPDPYEAAAVHEVRQ